MTRIKMLIIRIYANDKTQASHFAIFANSQGARQCCIFVSTITTVIHTALGAAFFVFVIRVHHELYSTQIELSWPRHQDPRWSPFCSFHLLGTSPQEANFDYLQMH